MCSTLSTQKPQTFLRAFLPRLIGLSAIVRTPFNELYYNSVKFKMVNHHQVAYPENLNLNHSDMTQQELVPADTELSRKTG